MDVTDIVPQLERLDGEIDDLEEVLESLLGSLPEVASKLPLLDKSKLYVLVAYALESMIFCKIYEPTARKRDLTTTIASLRLNGVNAKEHPIFKELARVRQYFEKIKNIENPPPKPDQSLNKEAAIRFIRADLADNKEVNTKLSEMIAKERAKAAIQAAQLGSKRKAQADPEVEKEDDSSDDSEGEEVPQPEPKAKQEKKEKKSKSKKKKKSKDKKAME
ncbi:putative Sas10/Utp3/C1D family-domain-containing protein [Seiridium unicorne]|uniref:Exosome complex protein n=1 Tax=Seiridium unicorne TaxID=138068 RepID=A0ABR2V1Y7_9PEZI